MSDEDIFQALEDIASTVVVLTEEIKKLRVAVEAIAQTVSPEVIEVKNEKPKRVKKKRDGVKNGHELSVILSEECPTLNDNIKDIKRFKSGDFLIKIDYVDMDTFKQIAREAEAAFGAKYSKKYRGFIIKGSE